MTIHANIGKAKSNFSKLIAASLRGEEVVICKNGVPIVRLTLAEINGLSCDLTP
ncbi:type II toxin-antitoxin system Phd/YefM family antitoxin [Novosphingobium sp. CECT 9465]|uniref:type II toxin-antitoxin system Phd/YefM family antitoxin n=1 Tax=Novosphingobium sp. CECT 9465 TaxID=2829794 RepID=UPI001E4CBEF4|nr:type II toxin-antitoxin system prevent-host-death family antitoxin [Novosphingobium sp. CECT 9465]CAH0497782.1 hypothetical protein NVSP9465_02852 [Novosphingobium sp. CECT 9465]